MFRDKLVIDQAFLLINFIINSVVILFLVYCSFIHFLSPSSVLSTKVNKTSNENKS